MDQLDPEQLQAEAIRRLSEQNGSLDPNSLQVMMASMGGDLSEVKSVHTTYSESHSVVRSESRSVIRSESRSEIHGSGSQSDLRLNTSGSQSQSMLGLRSESISTDSVSGLHGSGSFSQLRESGSQSALRSGSAAALQSSGSLAALHEAEDHSASQGAGAQLAQGSEGTQLAHGSEDATLATKSSDFGLAQANEDSTSSKAPQTANSTFLATDAINPAHAEPEYRSIVKSAAPSALSEKPNSEDGVTLNSKSSVVHVNDGVNVQRAEHDFQELSRELSRLSRKQTGTHKGVADVEKVTSVSESSEQEQFDLESVLRGRQGEAEEAGIKSKKIGVVWDGLTVSGIGGVKNYVKVRKTWTNYIAAC